MKKYETEVDLAWDGRISLVTKWWSTQKLKEIFRTGMKNDRAPVRLKVIFMGQPGPPKTKRQLGYLYGHLAPVAHDYLKRMGWLTLSKEKAVEEFAKMLGFVDAIHNEFTGEVIYQIKSVGDSELEELQEFIEAFYFKLVELDCEVMHPEQYLKP
jgi:hypothetical protein